MFRRLRSNCTYLSTLFIVLTNCSGFLLAQSPQTSHPRNVPVSKPPGFSDYEQFAPYWTAEASWRSELQLRNNLSKGDLTVTPVLRSHEGVEFPLAPVTIAPNEIKSVNVSDAITKAAPQLASSYGSVVFRYHAQFFRNLYAAVMVYDTGHPIAYHFDAFVQGTDFEAGSREGIWWLPSATAKDYLVLTNDDRQPLPVTLRLYDAKGKTWSQPITLQPKAVNRYSIRDLIGKAGLSGTYGGFKIDVKSRVGSLDTAHILFDEIAGFSALMKTFEHNPQAAIEQREGKGVKLWTTRAPMLALANPDAILEFSPTTVLQPQIFVRNTTPAPLTATTRFNWRGDSNTGSVLGPVLHLAPNQTLRLDVAALQKTNVIPAEAHWASVEITTPSQPDTLMAVAASYDSTLRFGAQTPFNDQLTYRWKGGEWLVDSTHDSIITGGNGGAAPTTAHMILYYDAGTKRYDIEQQLKPHEQMWIDVGKLIHNSVPDKNGQVLPPDLMMGSFELEDLTRKGHANLFEGKLILDRTYGRAVYGCAQCCGYSAPHFTLDPLGLFLEETGDQGVLAYDYCSGEEENVLDFFGSWGTGNSAVATAKANSITGVGAGSTTNFASGEILWSDAGQKVCEYEDFAPSGPVNVQPTVTVTCDVSDMAVVPSGTYGGTGTCYATGNPSGGTYTWEANFDKGVNTIKLSCTDSGCSSSVDYTAVAPSNAEDDTSITVFYTYNGVSAPDDTSDHITVHEPTSLETDSTTPTTGTCTLPCLANKGSCATKAGTSCTFSGPQTNRQYSVVDQFGNLFEDVDLGAAIYSITENVSVSSTTCGNSNFITATGGGSPFPDTLGPQCQSCCESGGPGCTSSVSQSISANASTVRQESISVTCTSVTLTP